MDSTPPPLPPDEHAAAEAPAPAHRSLRRPEARGRLADRWEVGLDVTDRWLHRLQDTLLVAVAVVMLLMGVFVLLTAVGDLVSGVTLRVQASTAAALHGDDGPPVVEVAENALLALILAELVGTLLLSIRGRPLAVEPFLAIAIVAVVRHLLLLTVRAGDDPGIHTVELLGMGGLVLLLVGALALLRMVRVRGMARAVAQRVETAGGASSSALHREQ
ncbi:MAG TPA: phosphate-starvation-inducible PsiE family protein [Chloroflexota bacterium]